MLYNLNRQCHMGCPHCMANAVPDGENADLAVTEEVVARAKALGIRVLGVSGGEPTEHPDFEEHLNLILDSLPRCIVTLISNGSFLLDPAKRHFVRHQMRHHAFFGVQITSVPGLYQGYPEIAKAWKRYSKEFPRGMFVTELQCIDPLGRARGRTFPAVAQPHQRLVPGCFNLFSMARSLPRLGVILYMMETQLKTCGKCTPMVSYDGKVFAGECRECVELGDVSGLTETGAVFQALRAKGPCGGCGVDMPEQYRRLFT